MSAEFIFTLEESTNPADVRAVEDGILIRSAQGYEFIILFEMREGEPGGKFRRFYRGITSPVEFVE